MEETNQLRVLDWQEILNRLSNLATSEGAREKLHNLSVAPNIDSAQNSFAQIEEARKVVANGPRPYMESLDLYSSWRERLKKSAVLKTIELKDVRRFCLECIALKKTLTDFKSPWLQSAHDRLLEAERPLSAIDHLMTPEGEIKTDASETLFRLHTEKVAQAREVQKILDRLIKKHEMEPILQDKYVTTREGRWVLPVRSGMQHQFQGIIHASSHSKQTVFMEPEDIVSLNNRLREIEVEIEDEIARLLKDLSNYLCGLIDDIENSAQSMSECDLRFAQAQLSEQLSAHPIQFSGEKIHLIDVRHPLLALNEGEKVIPNSLTLEKGRSVLLLSGPNAGGKTVLLKSVGLAAQMARCGLPVCAEAESCIPFFNNLHVAVGDAQSVDQHMSTFAAHLKVLSEASQAKGSDQLLLIDEICGSTDPEEGAALARAFIEKYAANKVYSVVTSHLGPLKLGWDGNSGVVNGSLEYNQQTGRPSYHFILGAPGQSLALETAKRVGVDKKIIEQAMGHLSPEAKARQANLEQIEAMKSELSELKKRLQQESRSAREKKDKYLRLVNKFKVEKEEYLQRVVKKAERQVEELISKAKVDQVFRKHAKLSEIKKELPKVIKTPADTEAAFVIETAAEFAKHFPPGSSVYVDDLGNDGIVQGEPNSKGEVPILSQSMRLLVKWRNLRPPRQAGNPTAKILRQRGQQVAVALQESERVIDLRGMTVEDAVGELEMQLDQAALQNEDRIKIIHGHGTEALKRAVRTHLSRSTYVSTWKAGNKNSGGDGVTWVEIKD